ncbi:NYN domain-containing protein [Microbacterium saccharophilum]|uniref:NYN domain-containing protein n=1 Tax=Microbacterium saccharophilum TaxID=1213358 RepID=A0A5C8I1L3_9MICO|nr:NYN domain-containing protein [Microbacterium saccharophilum]TXK11464.1 NYN domain-containing protein [Microbacterium saccharophilum]GEP48488.1 nuclease [Microbacterium saccharophilum]
MRSGEDTVHETDRTTWVLIDGENIDATLGNSILGRRPQPEERPRWDRILSFVAGRWNQQARGLFFLNASTSLPMSFVQALLAMNYQPVPLSGNADEKVVDIAIQRTLRALREREGDVVLVSHDRDFVEDVSALIDGSRRVGLLAFEEFRSSEFAALPGLQFFDLEFDVQAFDAQLPRVRVIPIAEFDPAQFLR